MKGMHVKVYRSNGMDCTNSGLTASHSALTLVGPGVPELLEATEDAPAVKLVRRRLFGVEDYLHAEPVTPPAGTGWMDGGNFIWSCDSRFPNSYPISVHDRQEF